ncbi:MAG: glycerol-3-phosphate 1-O-acyltransferase PlsY [Lachnospiraceae bacterium]|nr:glycerol-3-phosphate 1-O-acyltransferase PlsY [Lachnospiraceae bacterium]
MVSYLICLVIGYLCGCISSGYLVGKIYHIDIRDTGSGNAGTTNVLRTLGKLPALITFAGDLAKAIIPIVIIRCIFQGEMEYLLCLYFGLGVVLGHNFPFYLHFKGGKGIAVTAAVVLSAAHPLVIPIGLVIFITVVALTRYVSLGSLFVAWYIPANTLAFHRGDHLFIHMMVISLLFTILAYVQHRQNIVRLIHGTENKLGAKKS